MESRPVVDANTPGTAFLRRCTHCGKEIGEQHSVMCPFTTGADDPGGPHSGFDGARITDLNPVTRAVVFGLWHAVISVGTLLLVAIAAVQYWVRKLRGVK